MKHVEIIDGALNSRFEIYAVSEEDFRRVFGSKDEVYLEDLQESLQNDAAFWDHFYAQEVDRRTVVGIHGVMHTHPRAKVTIGV
jgi:hypothetical protein